MNEIRDRSKANRANPKKHRIRGKGSLYGSLPSLLSAQQLYYTNNNKLKIIQYSWIEMSKQYELSDGIPAKTTVRQCYTTGLSSLLFSMPSNPSLIIANMHHQHIILSSHHSLSFSFSYRQKQYSITLTNFFGFLSYVEPHFLILFNSFFFSLFFSFFNSLVLYWTRIFWFLQLFEKMITKLSLALLSNFLCSMNRFSKSAGIFQRAAESCTNVDHK